jgi:type I restriction enzyme M protein
MNHGEIVSFLWGIADLIRDAFKRGKYQDVILPLTVLRRLDCVLAHHKEKVLKRQAELRGKGLQDLDAQLRKASGFAFYNTSRYDFDRLLADAPHLAANLRNYIATPDGGGGDHFSSPALDDYHTAAEFRFASLLSGSGLPHHRDYY